MSDIFSFFYYNGVYLMLYMGIALSIFFAIVYTISSFLAFSDHYKMESRMDDAEARERELRNFGLCEESEKPLLDGISEEKHRIVHLSTIGRKNARKYAKKAAFCLIVLVVSIYGCRSVRSNEMMSYLPAIITEQSMENDDYKITVTEKSAKVEDKRKFAEFEYIKTSNGFVPYNRNSTAPASMITAGAFILFVLNFIFVNAIRLFWFSV